MENYKPAQHYENMWWQQKSFFGMTRSELVLVTVTLIVAAFVIWLFPGWDWVFGLRPK